MSDKAILGLCPNCGKEGLIIAEQFRDRTNWQIKYGIECQFCAYRFKVDKKHLMICLPYRKAKKKLKVVRIISGQRYLPDSPLSLIFCFTIGNSKDNSLSEKAVNDYIDLKNKLNTYYSYCAHESSIFIPLTR